MRADRLLSLMMLLQTRRQMTAEELANETVSERTISPYGLVAKASIWYLVAATDQGMRACTGYLGFNQSAQISGDPAHWARLGSYVALYFGGRRPLQF